jgi:hypothetical protein
MQQVYFQGRRTPDGPVVTRHDPPEFEGVVLPGQFEWGEEFSPETLELAEALLTSAWGNPPMAPEAFDFAEWVVGSLDRDEWQLTLGQVLNWNEKDGGV